MESEFKKILLEETYRTGKSNGLRKRKYIVNHNCFEKIDKESSINLIL